MSGLDLMEFHSFLEELIEKMSREGRFSTDDIVSTLIQRHPRRIAKIQDKINELGIRALIRNNCRAKNSATAGPDMFGKYHLGKRVSVPYFDSEGKLRWDKKRRGELSFTDIDSILSRASERPTSISKERQDLEDILRRTKPYRSKAKNIAEALKLAEQDDH